MTLRSVVLAAFSGATLFSGAAVAEGDVSNGQTYAKAVCSECHAVEADAKVSPNIKAPPFVVIANSKLVTSREIVAWLQSSHPDMPDLNVPAETRDDLLAFIDSLKQP